MKVVHGLKNLGKFCNPSVIAMGVFDGVHVGHRRIIAGAVKDARMRGAKSVVLTFDPHPGNILNPRDRVPSLISVAHRIRLIEELGVDFVVVIKFSRAIANMSAEDFVRKILAERLCVKEACVGDNFYFGRGGRSGVNELEKLGERLGFDVRVTKSIKLHGDIVSSSLIRRLITKGDLGRASKLLGRRISVLGTVVSGARLARELGYPTANINPHHEVTPPSGVYAVYLRFRGKFYKGVLNIGVKPTFYSPRDSETLIEAHIFDFKERIYGLDLEVFFIKKLRDEIAFSGKTDLIAQIEKDEDAARDVLKKFKAQCAIM